MQGIELLKKLHSALGDLLRLAETGQGLTKQLQRVKAIKEKALAMSRETLGITLAGIPQMASLSVFGVAAYTFINIISKGVSDEVSMGTGEAVMAAHIAGAIAQKPRRPA